MTKQHFFCIALILAFSQTAHTQLRIGIGGGINASSTLQRSSLEETTETLVTPSFAAYTGIAILWQRPSGFCLLSGLSFRNISNSDQLFWKEWAWIPQPWFGFNRKTLYGQIPLQAGYSWRRFRISSGPYAGLRIFETQKFSSSVPFAISPAPTRHWDFGWSGAVSIDMGGGVPG